MSEFNLDEYFAQRNAALLDPSSEGSFAEYQTPKQEALDSTRQRKIAALEKASAKRQALDKANEGSLVDTMGLDPDGAAGTIANLDASGISGAARVVGDIASTPLDINSMVQEAGIDQESRDAYARIRHDEKMLWSDPNATDLKASSEDYDRVNQTSQPEGLGTNFLAGTRPEGIKEGSNLDRFYDRADQRKTDRERLDSAESSRQSAEVVDWLTDWSGMVHQDNRADFSEDLANGGREGIDKLKGALEDVEDGDVRDAVVNGVAGLAKLVSAAGGAAVDNPKAVLEYVTENSSQLALGALAPGLMATSNLGYGIENYRKGMVAYAKKHDGKQPDAETRQRMALYAFSTIAAEQLGDAALLRGALKKTTPGNNGIKEATRLRSAGNVGKAAAGGTASETATEGYQTYAEGEAKLDPASGEDIFEGGVIGGMTGGVLSGGTRALTEAAQQTPEHDKVRAQKAEQTADFDAAVTSGDVSTYLDRDSRQYDPAKAVAALSRRSTQEDVDTSEREAAKTQAGEIVSDLEAEYEAERDALPQYQAQLAKVKASVPEGQEPEAESPTAKLIDALEQNIAEIEAVPAKRREAQLSQMKRKLDESRELYTRMGIDSQPDADDIGSLIEQADAPATANDPRSASVPTMMTQSMRQQLRDQGVTDAEIRKLTPAQAWEQLGGTPEETSPPSASQQAGDRVIELAMANPDALSQADATRLAENTDNGLSEPQRRYLRAFSANQIAENRFKDLETVGTQILTGGKGFKGISEYRSAFQAALTAKRPEAAKAQLDGLTRFKQDHVAKFQATRQAFKQVQGSDRTVQLVRDQQGNWASAESTLSKRQLEANGGLEIGDNPRSAKLIKALGEEAKVLVSANRALDAAYEVTFPTPDVEPEATSTPDPETAEAPETEPEQVPQDAPSPASNEDNADAPTTGPAMGTGPGRLEETPAPENETVATDGRLSVFQDAERVSGTLSTEVFKATNLAAAYFRQLKGDRPLVNDPDFLASLGRDTASAERFLTEPLEAEQAKLLELFDAMADGWSESLDALVKPKANPDYRYDDFTQYLLEEDGTLPANVKAGISVGAFQWLIETGLASPYANDEAINAALSRNDDATVSPALRTLLQKAGTRDRVVMNALGQHAAQALGLKAYKDAPANVQGQMEASLGAYALAVLFDSGLVQRRTVNASELRQAGVVVSADQESAVHHFISVNRQSEQAQDAVVAARGTHGILSKLFGTEDGLRAPSTEPLEFSQTTTKNTSQGVPTQLAEILEGESKKPHTIKAPMQAVFRQLDQASLERIAGVTPPERKIHKANRDGVRGKNDALRRELQRWSDFTAVLEDAESPLFFPRSVWKQHRVGIDTNMINPQTSKIHRHLLAMESWKQTVRLDDPAAMTQFRLAVADGLGVKTDKQRNEASLAAVDAKLASPAIRAGIDALRTILNSESMSAEDQGVIADAVDAAGENFHSLDVLVAQALYENARDAGERQFNTELMREVDGVTNGPMLAQLQLGAANSPEELLDTLHRGGFFEQGNAANEYSDWRSQPGNHDLYESLMAGISGDMAQQVDNNPGLATLVDALQAFTGQLTRGEEVTKDGRNLVKKPLTALAFGSGLSTAIDGMADQFAENIYTRIERLVNENDAEGLEAALAQLNMLTTVNHAGKPAMALDTEMTLEEALEFELTPAQTAAVKKVFQDTLGNSVETVMNDRFAAFMDKRQTLNQAAQTAWALYDMAYQYLKGDLEQQLIRDEKMAYRTAKDGTKVALQDLSDEQDQAIRTRLRDLEPVVHTPFSKAGNDLKSGIYLSKTGKELSSDPAYQNQVAFAEKVMPQIQGGEGFKTLSTKAYARTESNPGVAGLIMAIHSSDSAISAYSYRERDALNVHDAHGLGLADVTAGAASLNRNTFEVLRDYSVPTEMADALERTITGFRAFSQDLANDPAFAEAYGELSKTLYKGLDNDAKAAVSANGGDTLGYALHAARQVARESDRVKLDVLTQLQSVDQYALEGGHYPVSDADRATAQEKLDGLASQDTRDALDYAQSLNEAAKAGRKKPRAESGDISAEQMAATLRQYSDEARQTLRDQRRAGHTASKAKINGLRSLQKLESAYLSTGDIDRALERVFPGDNNQPRREAWKQRLINYMNERTIHTGSVLRAPDYQALALIDAVLGSQEITTHLHEPLRSVKTRMEQGNTLKEAVNTLPSQEQGPVMETLARYYNGHRKTAWGELGVPTIDSDPTLVNWFAQHPEATTGELIQHLEGRLTDGGQRTLMNLVKRAINTDIPVRYVTASSMPGGMQPTGNSSKSRGFYRYAPDPSREGLFIKSPEFVESGITNELLLHELTHAALVERVHSLQDMPDANPQGFHSPAHELLDELEDLRKMAEQRVKADDTLSGRFGPAVSNLDEFIAWGMSNADFQQEVLAPIEYRSSNTQNTLVRGIEAFIQRLVGLLLGRTGGTRFEDGLSVLVANVSGLFRDATENKDQRLQREVLRTYEDPEPGKQNVDEFSSHQILDALEGAPDADFKRHLGDVLEDVATRVYSASGHLRREAEKEAVEHPQDVFLKALADGQAPFASKLLSAGFSLTDQEAFVAEMVEASVKESLNSSTVAYREMHKLYKEAKAKMHVEDFHQGDWAQASPEEQEHAQSLYDFVFTLERNAEGTSDYLARFAALGLAWQPMHDKLGFNFKAPVSDPANLPLGQRLLRLVRRLLDIFAGRLTKTYPGQVSREALQALASQMTGIEARKRRLLKERHENRSLSDLVEDSTRALSQKARDQIEKVGTSPAFKDRKSGYVRAVGSVSAAIAGDRAEQMMEYMHRIRDAQFNKRQGLLASVVNEVRGANDTNLTAHELLRGANQNEQERQRHIRETADMVMESFANEGRDLTDADKAALTQAVLRSDLAVLAEHFDMATLETLVADTAARDQAIQDLETSLGESGQDARYYRAAAKDLGYYLATGRNKSPNLMLNAHNIAFMAGTGRVDQVDQATADAALPVIDQLASLYALRYTSPGVLAQTVNVWRTENQRDEGHGVELLIKLQQGMKQDALEALFEGSPVHMAKGYTREITNPYKAVTVANAVEGRNLERMGWSKAPNALESDNADPDTQEKHLYVVRDGGLQAHVTGIFSYTGQGTKGTTVHHGLTRVDREGVHQTNAAATAQIHAKKRMAIDAMAQAPDDYDPRKAAGNHLAPVLNERGEIVNYRYLMSHQARDTLLERNNAVEDVMGGMAGSLFDKSTTPGHNADAVKAFHDQYRAEYTRRPESYVSIGPDAKDPEMREIYRLLPDVTKAEIKRVWGSNEMKVRVDLLDIAFGYRKRSLASVFAKDEDERNAIQQLFVFFVEDVLMLKGKAALRVRQAEDVWQEIVKEVKDILVVKTGLTLLGNVISNLTELVWMGAGTDLIKNHRIAFIGAINYRRDNNELYKLRQLQRLNHAAGRDHATAQRIIELEDALKRNPVRELVEAGLLQTIVEDIDDERDNFSYKSWLGDKTEGLGSRLPDWMRTTGKALYMSHDMPHYKVLSQGTQLSDFVARYTLYQHVTQRKNNPLPKQQAIQLAVDAFVNYDIPTHRTLQYLNDMGIVWFTKYYLRIQKVIMFLWRDNPARALALLALNHAMPAIDVLTESSMFNRFGNPLSAGALEYPSTLDELATVKVAMSPFN